MYVIRANSRTRFTPADYHFLSSVLPGGKGSPGMVRLVEDADSLDLILDDPMVFRSVLELRGFLSVSLHFYFYVLVRQVLLREDIRDREVADYVAAVLAEFTAQERWRRRRGPDSHPMDYLFEMLEALERTDDDQRFELLAHIGNYALFLSGIFPGHLQQRMERRAAPGFRFYEQMGSTHFRLAGDHRLARKLDLASIFSTLGQAFHWTRVALNHLSEKLVFLETSAEVQALVREIENPLPPIPGSNGPDPTR